MQAVLLDTSLILDCAKRKIDVFAGLDGLMEGVWEAHVSVGVMREMRKKALVKGRAGAEARLALAMLDARRGKDEAGTATREGAAGTCVVVEQDEGNVDGWLLARGKALSAVVCTNDAEVRRKAREAGLKVISVLHNSRLGYA